MLVKLRDLTCIFTKFFRENVERGFLSLTSFGCYLYSCATDFLLVAGSSQLAAMSVGGVVGYPGVLLHQFRANDSIISLDLDTASWIGSLHGLAGIPSILMPIVMQWKGRKFAFIVSCFLIIIGWILVYTATGIVSILLSECFHGLGTNSMLAVSMLSMGEMLDPEYRNIFLLSFSILQVLGMSLVGIMTRYIHWKTISLIMTVPIILALIIASIWIESPSWLACKGEFDKCEQAFKLLRGTDDRSNKELEELIKAQKDILRNTTNNYHDRWLHAFFKTATSRDFYVPGLHMFVLLNSMYWSGLEVVLIYSEEVMEKVTTRSNAAFTGGLIINMVLFVCFTITGVLIRRFDNKPVLLLSVLGTSMCMMCASVVTYMQSVGILPKDSMIGLYCLLAFMLCGSFGLNSIIFTVAAELMPVKYRGIGGALYVMYTCLLHTTALKISPYLFKYVNMYGTFLIYTINAILCGFFIWKYVPETKGRTLQEIENFYKYGRFVRRQTIGEESRHFLDIK